MMSPSSGRPVLTDRICFRCGTRVTGRATGGLCPACLLREAITPEPACEFNGTDSDRIPDLPPQRSVGDYELLEEVGRGGMGVVYKARQLSLNRLVAVKMIRRAEEATTEQLARFQQEARLAAGLQHPHIVAIHELGEDDGQPYFSMDYVPGRNLAQLVRDRPLPPAKAAAYLKAIAQAVHYSHQQGLLHRDLKPSNVIIDLNEQPRVTDFGLARLLTDAQLSTADPQLTHAGQLVGSPAFMSPEQAGGLTGQIGPASDIYSLGALLYQLLTTRPPFAADNIAAMLRMVIEAEPVAPRMLNPAVPRDLETICLKCLQKEPQRRYASAVDLADELGRFLRGEPILARPVSRVEKAWRWCRRQPALASAIFLVLILLLVLGIGSSIAAYRINGAREHARTEAAKSEQVAQFLKDMLNGVGPAVAMGRDTKILKEILDSTAKRVGQELTNRPDVEAELRNTLGEVYLELGDYPAAEAMTREALGLRRHWIGDESPGVAESLNSLAKVLVAKQRLLDAEKLAREALALNRKLYGNQHPKVAQSLNILATALDYEARPDQAEPMYREALAIWRKLPEDRQATAAAILANLGAMLADGEGKLAESETDLLEAVQMQRRILGPENPATARALGNLGLTLYYEGKYTEAEATSAEVLGIWMRLVGNEHQKTAIALNNLGMVWHSQGKLVEAQAIYSEALAIRRKLLDPGHPHIATSLGNLALVLNDQGSYAESEALFCEVLELVKKRSGSNNPRFGINLFNLGVAQLRQDKFGEAETTLRQARELFHKVPGDESRETAMTAQALCAALREQDKLPEAEALGIEAVALFRKLARAETSDLADSLEDLAAVFGREGRWPEAEPLFRERAEFCETKHVNQWEAFYARLEFASCLLEQRKFAEAESLLGSGYDGLIQHKDSIPIYRRKDVERELEALSKSYEAAGRSEQAADWREKPATYRQATK